MSYAEKWRQNSVLPTKKNEWLFAVSKGDGGRIAFFSTIMKIEVGLIEGILTGEYIAAFNSKRDAAK